MLEKKAEDIYNKFSQEFVGDQQYGSLMTVAIILSIIVNLYQLDKICKERKERVGSAERWVIRRVVREKAPNLSYPQRMALSNIIAEEIRNLSEREYGDLSG